MPDTILSLRQSHSHLLKGDRERLWVEATITAPDAPADSTRQPADVVLVIDCSGSMGNGPGSPLDQALAASRYVLSQLSGEDRAAVLVYDDSVRTLHALSHNHEEAARKLWHITMGGMTALAPALYAGLDQLSGKDEERVRRVFLLSDGQANVGERRADVIADRVASMCRDGAQVSTFGLGPHYNELLLEAIAKAGGGNYYYLASADEAADAFANELSQLFEVTARDVQLTVKAATGAKVTQLLGLDAEKSPVAVGDIPAGATRTLLVEIELDAAKAGKKDAATFTLKWRQPDAKKATAESSAVTATVTTSEDKVLAGVDALVLAKVAEMEAAKAQAEAALAADRGDFAFAQSLIASSSATLASVSSIAPDAADYLQAKSGQLEANFASLNLGSYDSSAAKQMRYSSYATRNSRPDREEQ